MNIFERLGLTSDASAEEISVEITKAFPIQCQGCMFFQSCKHWGVDGVKPCTSQRCMAELLAAVEQRGRQSAAEEVEGLRERANLLAASVEECLPAILEGNTGRVYAVLTRRLSEYRAALTHWRGQKGAGE